MFPKDLLQFAQKQVYKAWQRRNFRLITSNAKDREAVLHLRQAKTDKLNQGFTLIELIVVIVILGILAATALPKFVNLGADARTQSLNSLMGAMKTAATMLHAKCAVSPGCSFVGETSLTINGTTHFVWYGWPIESSRAGRYWSIDQLIEYSGFTPSVVATTAYFDRPDAPTPSQCRVVFNYNDSDTPPNIQVISDGC